MDIAFTQDDDGTLLLHRIECETVRLHREQGRSVATLLNCEILPANTKQCKCISADERPEMWSKK